MTYSQSTLCRLDGMTCMGCCGNTFGTFEALADAIWRNTLEFHDSPSRQAFMERAPKNSLRRCGVCRNLVFEDDSLSRVRCPLHPVYNKDGEWKDIREEHCDTAYLCRAAFLNNVWNDTKRESFSCFLKSKNLDWYSFSMGMVNNSLVEEFMSESPLFR